MTMTVEDSRQRQLPATSADLAAPGELKKHVAALIQGLNLRTEVLGVLERAQQGGLPLSELLADPELIERLREARILNCLRVVI